MTTSPDSNSHFVRLSEDSFRPTAHAGGVWDPGEQHVSPLGGLIVHAIDRHRAALAWHRHLRQACARPHLPAPETR